MIKRKNLNWVINLGLLFSLVVATNNRTSAQVTADQTLETQVIDIGFNSFILGGTTVGNTNLFHSFASFNVPSNGAAIFINDPSLTNIFARVTGGTASDVQGRIGTQGTANLYLINPNGIIFGTNASLNIGGSFVATTANAIQFPGGAEFSLNSSVSPDNHLLRVNPTAFLFNQIANQGINSIENRGSLGVPNNKSLILLGGNIAPTSHATGGILLDNGRLGALDGRVEIGGLTAPGSVGINVKGNNLSLSFPQGVARTDIALINNTGVLVAGVRGGDVLVNANNLNLLNSTNIFTGIFANQGKPDSKTGDISINATGIVNLTEGSGIGNLSLGIGDSGNINIVAQSLNMKNGSSIQAITAQGESGIVNIKVTDTLSLNQGLLANVILSDRINIQAQKVSLANGALIRAFNSSGNDSVGIKIQAFDSLELNNASILTGTFENGNSGDLSIITNRLNLKNDSQIAANTFGSGNAGQININAADIAIDLSSISAASLSFPGVITNIGNAGTINIQTERISLTNRGFISSSSDEPEQGTTIGYGGNINITANELIEIDAKGATGIITGLVARTFSGSSAGDINLNTRNLIVRDGGYISVEAANNLGGNAGNITINASDAVELTSSNGNRPSIIFTGVSAFNDNAIAVGNGGDLKIITQNLQLTNSTISAGTFGQGNAGNINIFSNDGVVIDNSVINSRIGAGAVGNGGDIDIQTQRLTLTNGGGIDTIVAPPEGNLPGGLGKGGTIRINATDAVTISGTNADGFESAILTETQSGAFGQSGDIIINTNYFRVLDNGSVSTLTGNSSDAGNILINTRVMEVLNGGVIVTGTEASGKAGDITINATDQINILSNTDLNGNTGLVASTTSSGDAGNISLFTTDLNLLAPNSNLPAPVLVATLSRGSGIAGNINIVATGNYNANNGLISARSERAGGGNISVNARNINLRNNSDIRTDLSSGNGRGGGISLTADIIISLEDSDILAFAPEGQGGDIKFNTRAVFSNVLYTARQTIPDRNSLQSLVNNTRPDINATGTISGNIIGVPDISSIQNGLTDLQANPIDTTVLIANSCIARSPRQEGTFIITGTGGLPTRPGELKASSYATGDVQSVSNNIVASAWKKGDAIIEPQGVYRLANGEMVMSRECG
ncbi:Filamentous hemagglutinin-like protein [Trichormus variabilis ATCC 29413]|uniref:Filamentous hemagglutinin-like protein n=2 Tax=Anabaena variabilis TaxID=264691 RepID=Q3M9B2_TRIV2|nr:MULTISPECIES: S-layer family protein [Nostocaceae]ABA22424.1 Filamentous hemagglutinin-like protein [Trichormus variabilis ATCC 29413]MBC1215250.1 S-layer family protein [Trichormus variabilis ARAD]MBC1257003.1 S-layer family protein [Trichormus variabilis V5]MBC1267186.1 S-layer family protein [Trichormus variabilis FSR]MBC1303301.1 S-layer family protein [Trichormus variabilis N2B]